MAYNRNGQPYTGQYPPYQTSLPQPQQYPYQQQDTQQGRRPSFESGDDSSYGGRRGGNTYQSGNTGYIRMPEGSDFMAGAPQPGRTAASGAPTLPYAPSQNPPPQPPRVHAAYNPQQYATPAPYGSPPMSSPTTMAPATAPNGGCCRRRKVKSRTKYRLPCFKSKSSGHFKFFIDSFICTCIYDIKGISGRTWSFRSPRGYWRFWSHSSS